MLLDLHLVSYETSEQTGCLESFDIQGSLRYGKWKSGVREEGVSDPPVPPTPPLPAHTS